MVLYFGCRHKKEDFLYEEELKDFEKIKVLTELNVAFSRDQEQKVMHNMLFLQLDSPYDYLGPASKMSRMLSNDSKCCTDVKV